MPKVVKPKRFPWRLTFTIAAWTAVAGSAAMAARSVEKFVLTDSRFTLAPAPDGISFEGVRYASRARIARMFAPDFGRSAFQVPMAERRRRLLAIDWVESASILRIWPNRLIVRMKERTPLAFARLEGGHYMLIDSAGVFLAPPSKVRFDLPVLSGLTEELPEPARAERVRAMSALLAELGPQAKQISEINAASLEDLRLTMELEHHGIELWMGDRNYASRFQNFNNHYPEIHKNSPNAAVFDLRLDDRITSK
ncbi:MAG: Polypeptide-transport-associated domain protein FtsQ-type [Bryobacterales bacterium]|nr:Polypeptide-transport-associated domain protein FtsQ-type [Bryobacterales bacterium]